MKFSSRLTRLFFEFKGFIAILNLMGKALLNYNFLAPTEGFHKMNRCFNQAESGAYGVKEIPGSTIR